MRIKRNRPNENLKKYQILEKSGHVKLNCQQYGVKKPQNLLRNPNPPKGIFANVDFDRLNSKKVTKPRSSPEKQTVEPEKKKTLNER